MANQPDIEGAVQVPHAAHVGPSRFLPKKQPVCVTIEEFQVEEPTNASRAHNAIFHHIPRRNRPRQYPEFGRHKWCITFALLTAFAILCCVLAIVYRVDSQRSGSDHGYKPLLADRAPFICGTNTAHWQCTTRFAGPKAADMEGRHTLLRWMDRYCVLEPRDDFWLCGENLGADHGLPGGEGTWVEKVSDEMMQTGPAKQASFLGRPSSTQHRGDHHE